MVDSGQATVQQIDDSIVHGPGLRWPLMGPMLTFHLAGGTGGHGAHARPLRPGAARALDAAAGSGAHRASCATGWSRRSRWKPPGGASASSSSRRDAFLVDLLLLLDKHRTR